MINKNWLLIWLIALTIGTLSNGVNILILIVRGIG
jgi:hypothetical protein